MTQLGVFYLDACESLSPFVDQMKKIKLHYSDFTMDAMASQITSLIPVYSSVYSGADQRKHQSSASHAFLLGIHQWLVNSSHKWTVTRKMFPFDDAIMGTRCLGKFRGILNVYRKLFIVTSQGFIPVTIIRSYAHNAFFRSSQSSEVINEKTYAVSFWPVRFYIWKYGATHPQSLLSLISHHNNPTLVNALM